MKSYLPLSLLCPLLLLSCTDQPIKPIEEQKIIPPTVTQVAIPPTLEQVPAELSINHFSKMRLSGTGLILKSVLAEEEAYTRYSIAYQSNGLTISGIMNIPKGEGPFPLVILNHGFIAPSVYTNGRGLRREQDYLARQGFAILHTDYRGHASSDPSPDTRLIYDAGLEYSMDSINAIKAVREANLPYIDASRVGMLGHSLGGGVTLNIAVAHADLVEAIILYAPVHADAWENFLQWRDLREEGDRTRAALGTRQDNPKAWDDLSSLTHLAEIDDPVLLFHGTNDDSVPKAWSDFLSEKLTKLNKDFRYIEYAGEKHEFIKQWEDFMQQSSVFLKKHLTTTSDWEPPISQAAQRITKKPFGIYITPQDSPVTPERFTGYHTGVDYEVLPGEEASDLSVQAACTGKVIYQDWVKGYGGVVIQECELNGTKVTVLYGHLNLSSVKTSLNQELPTGKLIGSLGKSYTEQTDGERGHLHFAIHRGTAVKLAGYVNDSKQLSDWLNPTTVFKGNN